VTDSITVRLDGRVFTEAPLTSAASFSVNSNYKPQLTWILLRMDEGAIMHHIMSLLALGFLFAVLLGIV
jgi:hypothetical protein